MTEPLLPDAWNEVTFALVRNVDNVHYAFSLEVNGQTAIAETPVTYPDFGQTRYEPVFVLLGNSIVPVEVHSVIDYDDVTFDVE